MAKREVNKTQAVKDYLADNPDAATKDVVAAMKKQSVTDDPARVVKERC